MANQQQTDQLQTIIGTVIEYEKKSLAKRPEWGAITFDAASEDFDRIFTILNYLKVLPIKNLTDAVISTITAAINGADPILKQIDTFSIERADAPSARDNLVQQIHSLADKITTATSPWIPFLAYEKGDVSKNITALTAAVNKSEKLINDATESMMKKTEEIDEIIVRAREASASAGAAVFTADFKEESEKLSKKATGWLVVTALLAVVTIAVSVVTWFWSRAGLDQGQIWQALGSKFVTLSILITGTLWCGRIYKALMHQSTINKHRALSLQTFQAFSAATSDEQTKNAVLIETTRSIFANVPTGYISAKGTGDSDPKFIEIAKFLTSKD